MDQSNIDLLYVLYVMLMLPPAWRVFARSGLGGPMSLTILIPAFGPFLAAAILAFAEWPSASRKAAAAEGK